MDLVNTGICDGYPTYGTIDTNCIMTSSNQKILGNEKSGAVELSFWLSFRFLLFNENERNAFCSGDNSVLLVLESRG